MPKSFASVTVDPLRPKAAMAYWKGKAPVTPEAFKAMSDGARSRAVTVGGLARLDQVGLVHTAMAEALANGETLASFKGRIGEVIKENGWTSWRVENIYRSNMQQAYQAGRYAQMQEVKEDRPFWQYLAVGDRRTRPAHAVLNGMVYPADHPFWDTNYPPNGFQCRCTVRSLSNRQVEKGGLTVLKDMPGPQVWKDSQTGMEHFVNMPGPDAGFASNPGKDWLAGLAPGGLAESEVSFPDAPALCRMGGAPFADGGDPCRPPLAELAERHILPIKAGDILPKGLTQEAYAMAFLREFGLKSLKETTLFRLPQVELPLVIGKALFLDKLTGQLKADREGRGPYLRLLAQTIRNPYEIWLTPAEMAGKKRLSLRLIRLFRGEGQDVGGFGVFSLIGKSWHGSTVFNPKGTSAARMLEYLEKQRAGALVFREGE